MKKRYLLCFFLFGFITLLSAQTERAQLLQNNVVAITAFSPDGYKEYGFGIITGERDKLLFIATAAHVVEEAQEKIEIKFFDDYRAYPAKLLRQNTDSDIDIAVLEVEKPGNFRWEPDCLGIASKGDAVAFIGRDRSWYIPPASSNALGYIYEIRNNLIEVDINSVKVGTSGAPLINQTGIIGMIIKDEGSQAFAVRIDQIQNELRDISYWFMLKGAGLLEPAPDNNQSVQVLYQDLQAFDAAEKSDKLEAYKEYLDNFPRGKFRRNAIERIQELEEENRSAEEDIYWKIARKKDDIEGYTDYLKQFPQGRYDQLAKERLEELKQPGLRDDLVKVEGGSFIMGCTQEQGSDCYDNEKPAHKVSVPTFYIGKFELSKQAYVTFLNSIEEQLEIIDLNVRLNGNDLIELSESSQLNYRNGSFVVNNGYEQHPVNEVSWYGAVEYCNWLSRQSKLTPFYNIKGESVTFNANSKGYRLPSEAEWEFAARDGNQSVGNKYAGSNVIDEAAWYFGNSGGYTHVVGEKQANELGLADMSGNVWEWTNDCWNDTYSGAPSEGSAWRNGDCSRFVLRGGGCYYLTRYCRVSLRLNLIPPPRDDGIGFRLARAH